MCDFYPERRDTDFAWVLTFLCAVQIVGANTVLVSTSTLSCTCCNWWDMLTLPPHNYHFWY